MGVSCSHLARIGFAASMKFTEVSGPPTVDHLLVVLLERLEDEEQRPEEVEVLPEDLADHREELRLLLEEVLEHLALRVDGGDRVQDTNGLAVEARAPVHFPGVLEHGLLHRVALGLEPFERGLLLGLLLHDGLQDLLLVVELQPELLLHLGVVLDVDAQTQLLLLELADLVDELLGLARLVLELELVLEVLLEDELDVLGQLVVVQQEDLCG